MSWIKKVKNADILQDVSINRKLALKYHHALDNEILEHPHALDTEVLEYHQALDTDYT